jgi:acetyl-CoA carboxylase, biotin carboxylase subunit
LIADRYGNTLALAERECSVQRRHQKMIEECPSPAIQAELRARLNEAAVTIAQAAEYVNVGTVEFLLDSDHNFYFLEMNTRLQVEHPVTEIVTGADLVADQIRVAAGDPLGYSRETFSYRGWAIECRISAEDPEHGFVPSVGQIVFAREPAGPGVRVESALYDGIRVSEFYDPLVAKVTAWGRDRREAIRRMRRALEEFKIVGVQTNIPFHVAMLNDSRFLAGELDTEMVERGLPATPIDGREAGRTQAALVMAALLQHARRQGHALGGPTLLDGAAAPSNGHDSVTTSWRQAGRAASTSRAGASGWRKPIS